MSWRISVVAGALIFVILTSTPLVVGLFTDGQAASHVLGQSLFTTSSPALTQTGMDLTTGIALDSSGNIWVADVSHNRILEFSPPFTDGQAASHVLGQSLFTTNGYATTQTGMNNPFGVAFDSSGNLWVADANNNRVLEFSPPFTDGQAASHVLGQSDLTSGVYATTQTGMYLPTGVAFDSSGNIWVADALNNRIL